MPARVAKHKRSVRVPGGDGIYMYASSACLHKIVERTYDVILNKLLLDLICMT